MNSPGGAPYFPPPPGHFGRLPPQPPFQVPQPPPYTQQAYPPSPIRPAQTSAPTGTPVNAPYGPIPGAVALGVGPSSGIQSQKPPPPTIHTAGTWPQAAADMASGKVPAPPPPPPAPAPAQHQQQGVGYGPSPATYGSEYAPSPMSSVASPVQGFNATMRPPMPPSSCVSPAGTPQAPFQLPYAQTFPVSGNAPQQSTPSPAPSTHSLQGSFAAIPPKSVVEQGPPAIQTQAAQPTYLPYHPAVSQDQPASTPKTPQTAEGASTTYGGWPASLSKLDISRFLPHAATSAAARIDPKPSQAASQPAWTVVDPFARDNDCHELAGDDIHPPVHNEPAPQKTYPAAHEKGVDVPASMPPPATGSVSAVVKEMTKHLNEVASPKDLASTSQPMAASELPGNQEPQAAQMISPPQPRGQSLNHARSAEDPGWRSDAEPELWKRPYPPMRLHGTPSPVVFECQEERELDYKTLWYRLPDVPGFLACTLCHKMYIKGTVFESSFEAVELPRGRCRFNVPRLTRSLVPDARRRGGGGDVQPIREFAMRRLEIQDCHGQGGVSAEAKVKWFKSQDPRLDWFVACEACHEDVVQGTPFRDRFVASPAQPEDKIWGCDVCVPYIKRALLRFSSLSEPGDPSPRWDAFVEAANRSIRLPKCEGIPVAVAEQEQATARWYRPTAPAPGDRAQELVLCEACFCDKVALTSLETGFELVTPSPQQQGDAAAAFAGSEIVDFLTAQVRATVPAAVPATPTTCLGPTMPATAALASAAAMQDIEVLRTAARTIVASPPCTESGIVGGRWFTLSGGENGSDFAICAACHAAWIEAWGLAGFFTPTDAVAAAEARLCSLHPTHPRFRQLVPRLGEAVETGVWAPFPAAVRVWAGVPPCPRSTLTAGRRWWGHDDCTVCEECHLSFCRSGNTAMAASLPLRGDVVAAERMCCMYSPRMRQQWLLACEQGSPDGLVAFSRQRLAVYAQTVPQIKFLRGMQELQTMQAMHSGMMSTMYSGMASFREVAGTTDGYLHGNSTLCWHTTDEGATSAAFSQQMSAGFAASNAPWAQILQLATLWDQWE